MPCSPYSLKESISSLLLRFTPRKRHPETVQSIPPTRLTLRDSPVAESPTVGVHHCHSTDRAPNQPLEHSQNPRMKGYGVSPQDSEELIDTLHCTLRGHNTLHPPDSSELPPQCDFIYDVMLLADQNTWIRRRMVVDFETDINIMREAVYRRMKYRVQPYSGEITWWNRPNTKPLGKLKATLQICGRGRTYYAEFYVVKNAEFDLLLGRPSVREIGLYRADPAVATRLRLSNQQ
ncbi:retropepsin-like aspartic protease [Aspergillus tanneri]|uniref:Uncharacterized protein n=1 Tax=Aspergillus tanneri TaxID=1220188 RepID=A0A5M9MUZ5_9EURO|nr:uncharacterized protein ATNIH1004_003584 [Aspergillus tanneri]KAA8650895.1 hypothetical protein ATNIH1004_003584 [Aspergillus tanneri]